jgi:hypothetical protein
MPGADHCPVSIRPRDGLEAIPQLRAVLGPRLRRWPWPAPAGENGTGPVGDAEWEVEALPEQPRATLWPYRPKREPDELISSWLWRIARGLGAPPKRFVLDAIGSRLTDVDREISDTAIDRLAFLSGQSREHLMGGTMRADIEVRPGSRREQVQRALLRHGDLVLNRHHGGRGRAVPIVQYCPVCLAAERTAYLRRGWRFSIEVACVEDGCFLLDACWKCGALLNPLAQAVPATAFVCVKCCAPLAKAPSLRMREAVGEQTAIYEELHRLAFTFADDFVGSLPWTTLSGSHPVICGAPIQTTPLIATMPSCWKHGACANGARMGQACGCARPDGGPQRPADQAQRRADDPASRRHSGRTHGLWINI